jgi:hypothetical protein
LKLRSTYPRSMPDRRRFFLGCSAVGASSVLSSCKDLVADPGQETSAGWRKSTDSPVFGAELGTIFGVNVLQHDGGFKMWFSWQQKRSIGFTESADGVRWKAGSVVLAPDDEAPADVEINRPSVVWLNDRYYMWYTDQTDHASRISHAVSPDGLRWSRAGQGFVVEPKQDWEKSAVMCPTVIWDAELQQFRMWYSAGDRYEPQAIGYCVSRDGEHWIKPRGAPVFVSDKSLKWEAYRVACATVQRHGPWHLMFYIGFADAATSAIGVARSIDGIRDWERHPANPIIREGSGFFSWDRDAVYKPSALLNGDHWMLWYNARRRGREQIGLAIHAGADLNF